MEFDHRGKNIKFSLNMSVLNDDESGGLEHSAHAHYKGMCGK